MARKTIRCSLRGTACGIGEREVCARTCARTCARRGERREARQAVPGRGSCWGGRRVRRLRCGARLGAASPNSLRSLRSAPFKQRRRVSLRSALRAPAPSLRSSPPQKSPRPGTACRAATVESLSRGARAGSRSSTAFSLSANTTLGSAKARSGRSEGASSALRSGRLVARARSALRELTCRRLSERSARRARSEFRRRATRLSTARQSAVPSRPPK